MVVSLFIWDFPLLDKRYSDKSSDIGGLFAVKLGIVLRSAKHSITIYLGRPDKIRFLKTIASIFFTDNNIYVNDELVIC